MSELQAINHDGFSRVEYLVILISIVYGLSLVDLFENWGRMIRRRSFYWETFVWSVIMFLAIAKMWHSFWTHIGLLSEHTVYFLLLFSPAMVLYAIIALLFPDRRKKWDLKSTFASNRKHIFSVMAILVILILAISNLLDSPVPILNISRLVLLALLTVMIFWDSKNLRMVVAAIAFAWYFYGFFFAAF